jgi:hypothetical protein
MKGKRRPILSDKLPKYPLLRPAVASATPSSIPIQAMVNPIDLRNTGIIGYSISLAISLKRLTNDINNTTLVINLVDFI